MLKILKKSVLVPAVFVGMCLGCANEEVDLPNVVKPVEIPENIAAGTNRFAFNFFQNLQQTQPANENLFVSPLSLHMALGMLLNGSENETASEILKTLQMEGVSIDDLNKAYKTLLEGLPEADSKVSLGLANSMWHKSNFQVESDFKNILNSSFKADVTGLPFDNAGKDKINQWASDKTNGKIKKVIEEISENHVMFLLNALYFKGDWKNRFDVKNTRDAAFKLENGTDKQVKMMFTTSGFKAAVNSTYNAIQLPYANGQFNMTLLIPKGENTVSSVISGLGEQEWNTLQTSKLANMNAEVGLPRFQLSYSAKLNGTLGKMGINKVFTNGAQLGKINKTAPLQVDFVKQDSYLAIDEKGTEAAAVTTIGVVLTSAGPEPPRFICDRPFVLVISEKTSNTILFMGRIMNPESK